MSVNYTQDQVEFIVNQYRLKPDRETVENLAEELDKSIKSIIGKLSREGVYKKTIYKTKTGETPETKKDKPKERQKQTLKERQTARTTERKKKRKK